MERLPARAARLCAGELEHRDFATAAELLRTVGQALPTSIGGAAGVVFGTLFRGGAKRLEARRAFDSEALRRLGHPDPGALSVYLILKAMADYVARGEEPAS